MSSRLVHYRKISPNRNSPRNHKVDTITIHCTAGLSSLEGLGSHFGQKSTGASANYAVDNNGLVGLYVEESDRSWASSSRENDNRAITIEVCTESKPPYKCSDAALNGLIQLLVDICTRYDIAALLWKNDKSLIGHTDKQNVTIHRWFSSTDCPGEYLLSKLPEICERVNTRLGTTKVIGVNKYYRVQIGAFSKVENAQECQKKAKAAGFTDAFITYG